ncbi:MAG TPA: hypothetical protein VIN59_06530 [Alphaproteobacteria bacterium]
MNRIVLPSEKLSPTHSFLKGQMGIDTRTQGWFVFDSIETIPIEAFDTHYDIIRGVLLDAEKPTATYLIGQFPRDLRYLKPLEPLEMHKTLERAYALLNQKPKLRTGRPGMMGILDNCKRISEKIKNNAPEDIANAIAEISGYMRRMDALNDNYNKLLISLSYRLGHWIEIAYGKRAKETVDEIYAALNPPIFKKKVYDGTANEEHVRKPKKLVFPYTEKQLLKNKKKAAAKVDAKAALDPRLGDAHHINIADLDWLLKNITSDDDREKLTIARDSLNRLQLIAYGVSLIDAKSRPSLNDLATALNINSDLLTTRQAEALKIISDAGAAFFARTYLPKSKKEVPPPAPKIAAAPKPRHSSLTKALKVPKAPRAPKGKIRPEKIFFNVTGTEDFGWFIVETDKNKGKRKHRIKDKDVYLSPNAVKLLRHLYQKDAFIKASDIIPAVLDTPHLLTMAMDNLNNVMEQLSFKNGEAPFVFVRNYFGRAGGYRFFKQGDERDLTPDTPPKKEFTPTKIEDFGYFKIETDETLPASGSNHRIEGTSYYLPIAAYKLLLDLYKRDRFATTKEIGSSIYPGNKDYKGAISKSYIVLNRILGQVLQSRKDIEYPLASIYNVGLRFYKLGEPRANTSAVPSDSVIKKERKFLFDVYPVRDIFELAAKTLDEQQFQTASALFLRRIDLRENFRSQAIHLQIDTPSVREIAHQAKQKLLDVADENLQPFIARWKILAPRPKI